MSNYAGDYKYPNDPFSFGSTVKMQQIIQDSKDEFRRENMEKELEHEDKINKR